MSTKKTPSDEHRLVLAPQEPSPLPASRIPEVRPARSGRRARKAADAERERQWRMWQTTQRSILAAHSIVAVAVHAQEQLDMAQGIMADRFYDLERHDAMNPYMQDVTSKCLSVAEAAVLAILESHAKRLAEDL